MQGDPVAVTARFSNGAGDPSEPDYAPDVRGLAVTFHLRTARGPTSPRRRCRGSRSRSVGPFVEFIRLSKPSASSALKMPLFFARHPGSIAALRGNLAVLKPPPSYAAIDYYALHAFRWVDCRGWRAVRPLRVEPTRSTCRRSARERRSGSGATTSARSSEARLEAGPGPLRARGPGRRPGRRPRRPLERSGPRTASA